LKAIFNENKRNGERAQRSYIRSTHVWYQNQRNKNK
jgi:hypothetical protein